MRFEFKGKSGVQHAVSVTDKRIARIVQRCQELRGEELFKYLDDEGKRQEVDAEDVNAYLQEITGRDVTAKDFRTWAGTMLAAAALRMTGAAKSKREAEKNIVAAVDMTAKRLGNTRSVCRKYYIHPALIEAYLEGSVLPPMPERRWSKRKSTGPILRQHEMDVLGFLKARLKPKSRRASAPAAPKLEAVAASEPTEPAGDRPPAPFDELKPVLKKSIAAGRLDGLDWLQTNGYRTVLHLRQPGEDDSADRRQIEKRGLKYLSLELSPQTLTQGVLDEFNRLVRREVEERNARIVMLDSIAGYRMCIRGEDLVAHVAALIRYLKNMGVTALLINETESITGGEFRVTEIGISYLADNILFLRYLETNGELHKAIGVLKKRMSDFENSLRELEITRYGIKVGKPLTNLRGILTGTPQFGDR